MPRFIYSFCLILLQPLVLMRLFIKSRGLKAYRNRISERYGFNAPKLEQCIWVHAVSVGESITAKPVIEHLLQHSSIPIMVTTTTPTGAEQVRRMFGERVIHRYMPQDISWCVRAFIRACKPKLLLIMETELWPNTVHVCSKGGIPLILLNGRLSQKSANAYGKITAITAPMLAKIDCLLVQTKLEKQRFESLGAKAEALSVVPSLKFEASLPDSLIKGASAKRAELACADRFVWIAASTHKGEEDIILAAHKQLIKTMPQALLILVPRHPERFDTVAGLCDQQGLSYARYSLGQNAKGVSVLLGDVMGQLMGLYGVADIAFVGGSLNQGGGHNIMEPALWAKPIISGPGRFNFWAVSEQMLAAKAMVIVNNADELSQAVQGFNNNEHRQDCGARAKQVALQNRGGLNQTITAIDSYL